MIDEGIRCGAAPRSPPRTSPPSRRESALSAERFEIDEGSGMVAPGGSPGAGSGRFESCGFGLRTAGSGRTAGGAGPSSASVDACCDGGAVRSGAGFGADGGGTGVNGGTASAATISPPTASAVDGSGTSGLGVGDCTSSPSGAGPSRFPGASTIGERGSARVRVRVRIRPGSEAGASREYRRGAAGSPTPARAAGPARGQGRAGDVRLAGGQVRRRGSSRGLLDGGRLRQDDLFVLRARQPDGVRDGLGDLRGYRPRHDGT